MDNWLVVRDGWIPEKFFDSQKEAEDYALNCNRKYQGFFKVHLIKERKMTKLIKNITRLPNIVYGSDIKEKI